MISPRTSRYTLDSGADTSPSLHLEHPTWVRDALCKEESARATVGMHFVDAERYAEPKRAALQVCGLCLVRVECLEHALADPSLVGIWGGTDSAARRAIRTNRARIEADSAQA